MAMTQFYCNIACSSHWG